MAKKYYAVREGKKTGIFTSWDICKKYVNGYSGAEYKGFAEKADAENYLKGDTPVLTDTDEVIAYVDGSFDNKTHEFSCGAVIFFDGEEHYFSKKFNDPNLAQMRNVAGEIKGAEKAMEFALEHKARKLTIYYDYQGIAKWCNGQWKAKKDGTKAYKAFYEKAKKHVDIDFVKVKGHSGNKYNDLADKLAKEALGKK